MQPPESEIPEIRLVLREGPNGDLGVQIYDMTDSQSPLTLLAAGLISELKTEPSRILARGISEYKLWNNSFKETTYDQP